MIWLFNLTLILIVFFLKVDVCREYIGYFYLIQYISFIVYVYDWSDKKLDVRYFFSPIFISLSYFCITFGFASLYLNAELGYLHKFIQIYEKALFFKEINLYFLVCNLLLFVIYSKNLNSVRKVINLSTNLNIQGNIISIQTFVIAIVFFILFSFFSLDASELGGSGSLSFVPKFLSSIVIVFYLSEKKIKYRYGVYLLLVFIFLVSNFDSKREIFFLLIAILFLEFMFNEYYLKINIKTIFLFFGGSVISLSIIIVASIFRGYGDYKIDTSLDAITLIPEYLESDFFWDAIGENLELNYSYGNALNSADLYLSGKSELLYGETFAKVFFVPLPRSIFEYKPRAIVEIYSPLINYGTGEIQPVVVYSEALWNFSILFFVPLILVFWISERVYIFILKGIKKGRITVYILLGLFYVTTFLQFVRGSGLDLLMVYVIVAIPFALILVFFNKFKITV